MHAPRRRLVGAASLVVAMLTSSLVLRTSTAAFTASTSSTGNTWAAGTVALGDDDSGSALFTSSGMYPGVPVERCITVTYSGSVPHVWIKVYGALTAVSPLAPYLDLTIARGSVPGGTAAGSCTGFTSSASVYSGTLTAFTTAHTSFATGADDWRPSPGGTATFRLTLSVQDTNDAQGKSAAASFTWESQSRVPS